MEIGIDRRPATRRRLGLAAVFGAALLLSACGGSAAPAAGPPKAMLKVSGDGQTGSPGSELALPLVVQVVDEQGRPVAGQVVNFRAVSGGGGPFAGVGITNQDGTARDWWTLGPTVGLQRLEARAVDPATGARLVFAVFEATATAAGGGTTSCAGGLLACGGACVDPANDPAWCGASGDCAGSFSGTACGAGQVCSAGACVAGCSAYAPRVGYPVSANQPRKQVAVDFDGDGKLDVATTVQTGSAGLGQVEVFLGRGDGTLAVGPAYTYPIETTELAAVDLDRDGRVDLVVSHWNGGGISVLRGLGGGAFAAPEHYAAGAATELAVIDFDRDGLPDLAVTESVPGSIVLFRNAGGGALAEAGRLLIPAGNWQWELVQGDLDGDGLPDLVAGLASGFAVYRGLPAGGFDPVAEVFYASAGTSTFVKVADLDGDGLLDVVEGVTGGFEVFWNTGASPLAFTSAFQPIASTGGTPTYVFVADLDGDGRTDVQLGGDGPVVSLVRNAGARTFGPVQRLQLPASAATNWVLAADLDADGRLDLVTGEWGDGQLGVHLATGAACP